MNSYKSAWTIGFGLFFVSIGTLILLDNLDILYFRTVWSFFWPFLLILIGLILVFRKKEHVIVETKNESSEEDKSFESDNAAGIESDNNGQKTDESYRSTIVNDNQQSHYFGNINYSSTDKDFQGLNISNIFGDIYIDISQIDFESGQKKIDINGIFGSIKVKLPHDISSKFIGSTIVGSVKFMDKDKDGLLISLNSQTSDFDISEKKILIRTSIIFGDIEAY
jgi:predicted membrane protein